MLECHDQNMVLHAFENVLPNFQTDYTNTINLTYLISYKRWQLVQYKNVLWKYYITYICLHLIYDLILLYNTITMRIIIVIINKTNKNINNITKHQQQQP